MRMKFRRFSPLIAEVFAVLAHLPICPRFEIAVDARHHFERCRHGLLLRIFNPCGKGFTASLAEKNEADFLRVNDDLFERERMRMRTIENPHRSSF